MKLTRQDQDKHAKPLPDLRMLMTVTVSRYQTKKTSIGTASQVRHKPGNHNAKMVVPHSKPASGIAAGKVHLDSPQKPAANATETMSRQNCTALHLRGVQGSKAPGGRQI